MTGRRPDEEALGNYVADQDVVSVDEDVGAIEPAPADDYYDPADDQAELEEADADLDEGWSDGESVDDLEALDRMADEGFEIADGVSYTAEVAVKETALSERRREVSEAAIFKFDPAVFAAAEQRLFEQIASGETLHRAQQRVQEAINQGLTNQGFDMQG